MSEEISYKNPAVTSDVILFNYFKSSLKILLIKRKHYPFEGMLAFPGGFIEYDESVEDAALRELFEETSLPSIPIQQLECFSKPDRDPRQRVITVAFISLVSDEHLLPVAGDDAKEAQYYDILEIAETQLAFDHNNVFKKALNRLIYNMKNLLKNIDFFPENMTLSDLKSFYNAIKEALKKIKAK